MWVNCVILLDLLLYFNVSAHHKKTDLLIKRYSFRHFQFLLIHLLGQVVDEKIHNTLICV